MEIKQPRKYKQIRGRESISIVTPVPSGVIIAVKIAIAIRENLKFLIQVLELIILKAERFLINMGRVKAMPQDTVAARAKVINWLISK